MEPVYIGVDLGTTLRRKSTGIASLVQKDNKPCIQTLPEHIISDDELIRSCIRKLAGNKAKSSRDRFAAIKTVSRHHAGM